MIPTLKHYSDMVSDVPSRSVYGIILYFDILSGITISNVHSDILSSQIRCDWGRETPHLGPLRDLGRGIQNLETMICLVVEVSTPLKKMETIMVNNG